VGSDDSRAPSDRFASDVSLYTVAEMLPSVLGFVALAVFTREFTPAAYGRYALVVSVVAVVSTMMTGWLERATVRFASELDEDRLLNAVRVSILAVSIPFLAASSVVYVTVGQRLDEFAPFFPIAVALVLVQGGFDTFRKVLQAQLQAVEVTLYTFVQAAMKLGLALVLALVVLQDITGWLLAGVLGTGAGLALMLVRHGFHRADFQFDRDLLRRFAAYGIPLVAWLLAFNLVNHSDRVLLEVLRGSTEVGIYASNYTLASRGLLVLLTPAVIAAEPLVMDTWNGENVAAVRELITDLTRQYLILAVPAVIGISIGAKLGSSIVFDGRYVPGFRIIPLVAVGLLAWYLGTIGHAGFQVRNRTRTLAIGVTISLGVNLLLNLLLIPSTGYIGAGIATAVAFTTYPCYIWVVSRRDIAWRLPRSTVVNTIAGGVAMAALPALGVAAGLSLELGSLLLFPGGLLYLGVLLQRGELTETERQKLRRLGGILDPR